MSETVKYNNRPGLAKPLGAYVTSARAKASELVFIAGQLAVNEAGELVGKGDFGAQMRQVFDNLGPRASKRRARLRQRYEVHCLLVAFAGHRRFTAVRKELYAKIYPGGRYRLTRC